MATKKSVPKTVFKKAVITKAATKSKVVAKARPTAAINKKASLQQQLEALHAQMAALNTEAVNELKAKISDTKKMLRGYELQLELLTGKPAGETKVKRVRRPGITDERLQPQMLAVMAKNGKEGLNARQLSEHLSQDAIRIRKFIGDNPKLLKRTGIGSGTKFFLP